MIVVDGRSEEVPGLRTVSFQENPKLALVPGDYSHRRVPPHAVVLHTTMGVWPKQVLPGLGPDTNLDERIARLWSTDGRQAGAHLSVDHDGLIACHADLVRTSAYHAGPVNSRTVGIEIYEKVVSTATNKYDHALLYEDQLDVVVRLCDWLSRRFGIQRQAIDALGIVPRCRAGGGSVVGFYGHRNVSQNRGRGDPGDEIFARLVAAGYERFDFTAAEDLDVWKARQRELKITATGFPGQQTRAALAKGGKPHGLWIGRPGD